MIINGGEKKGESQRKSLKKETHLFGWKNGNGGFGGQREMVMVRFGVLVPFEGATDGLLLE